MTRELIEKTKGHFLGSSFIIKQFVKKKKRFSKERMKKYLVKIRERQKKLKRRREGKAGRKGYRRSIST